MENMRNILVCILVLVQEKNGLWKEGENKLKKLTQDAFKKDIFGAPTFVVNKKIFWGQDRLDYALDEFKNSI